MRLPTPEEKLLRLIRGKSVAPQTASGGAPAAAAPPPRGLPINFFISGWQWVTIVSVLLGLILIVEVATLIFQFTRPVPSVEIRPVNPVAVDAPAAEPTPVEPIPSLAAAAQRPVFVSPVASTGGSAEIKPPSTDAKQFAAKLTLTGIITGDPPQAILEDTETKKTYFVSPGQVVDGAVVESVLENRVILNLQGEKVELGL